MEQLNVWNIQEQLCQSRVVKIYGQIDTKTAYEVCSILDVLNNDDPETPIKLEVNTPGGSVLDGLAICSKIMEITAPVIFYGTGHIASMGTVIMACCDVAYVSEDAYVMIHELSSGVEGKYRDMKASVEFDARLNEHIMGIIAKKCNVSYEKIMADAVRDKWMNAKETVLYGLADGLTPKATKNAKTIEKLLKEAKKHKK